MLNPGAVFSEIYQVTGPVERFASNIASEGWIVALPSSFHEFEGPEAISYDTEGTDRGNRYKVSALFPMHAQPPSSEATWRNLRLMTQIEKTVEAYDEVGYHRHEASKSGYSGTPLTTGRHTLHRPPHCPP